MCALVRRPGAGPTLQGPLVKRPEQQAAENLASAGDDGLQVYHFNDVIKDIQARPVLQKSNIFIFGKVGFFDLVCKQLSNGLRKNKSLITCRNTNDLRSIASQTGQSSQKQTILLLPATRNHEDLNQLVVSALETQMPFWLVALPSQIEKHLLVAFDCFFLAPSPKTEFDIIADIAPITEHDRTKLCDQSTMQALLVMNKTTSLGQPNRLGSVIYISKLE